MYHLYIQCHECGHKWETLSEDGVVRHIICPNCGSDQLEILIEEVIEEVNTI